MKIDKTGSMPLYSQVESILEEKIVSGQWSKGFQIPTETELAKSLDVSNITIKRAVINLVDKGMLFRQRGKGTFVTNTVMEKNIYTSAFFTMENEVSSSHEMLEEHKDIMYPKVAKTLNLPSDQKFFFIKRLGLEDGEPVSVEYTYLPQSFNPELLRDIKEDDFVYDILVKKCGIELKNSKNYFSGTIANEEEVALLNVDLNTPLFVWERITYSKSDEPIEYSKFVMRQDKEKYYLEVQL
ncbi:GntR family transcriptional regulator [Psychrobacillus sp. L4]|uniref:GntR family transcriptional regulator n=1 Tax=Psychrobacillus sp. L4 TaxID=3236892 RepID=UPI0036F43AD6